MVYSVDISTSQRCEFVDITGRIEKVIKDRIGLLQEAEIVE